MDQVRAFIGPQPSLAIVKFRQGIVEIALRGTAIVRPECVDLERSVWYLCLECKLFVGGERIKNAFCEASLDKHLLYYIIGCCSSHLYLCCCSH